MTSETDNQPLSALSRALTVVECVVLLIAGVGPFLAPSLFVTYWPWVIKPFSLHFVASIYLSALISILMVAYYNRWSPGRLGLQMIFLFTLIILVVTLLHLSQFDMARPSTWVWILLYIALPLNAGYHLWLYRQRKVSETIVLPTLWRYFTYLEAIVAGGYGIALLIIPATSTAFWPWGIGDFQGRIYSAVFVTGALASFVLARGATALEIRMVGLTQTAFGIAAILGLFITDSSVPVASKVNWSLAGTWLWLGFFILILLGGLVTLILPRWSSLKAPAQS